MSETYKRVEQLLQRRPDISPAVLAGYVSLPRSTALNFIGGVQDRADTPRVWAEFERVLAQIESGDILRPGDRVVTITDAAESPKKVRKIRDFYAISTVAKVGQVIDYCAEHSLIGVVTGNYGVGKTDAIQHWRATSGRKVPHAVLEFNDFTSRIVIDFLTSLGQLLGIALPMARGRCAPSRSFDAITEHLRAHPVLLILDQCETVQPRIAQIVRQIWDRTRLSGVGLVMLASPLLMDRMHRRRAEDLGALTSRVAIWAQLQGVSRAEAAEILKKEGVANIDAEALDLLCRMIGGSMRRLMAVSQLLVDKHSGKAITERTIEGVAEHLWGMSFPVSKRVVAA